MHAKKFTARFAPSTLPLVVLACHAWSVTFFRSAWFLQVSKACTSICMWVRAMYKYHTVALSVAPKRAALAQAQSQLDGTLAELAAAQAKLQASHALSDLHSKHI